MSSQPDERIVIKTAAIAVATKNDTIPENWLLHSLQDNIEKLASFIRNSNSRALIFHNVLGAGSSVMECLYSTHEILANDHGRPIPFLFTGSTSHIYAGCDFGPGSKFALTMRVPALSPEDAIRILWSWQAEEMQGFVRKFSDVESCSKAQMDANHLTSAIGDTVRAMSNFTRMWRHKFPGEEFSKQLIDKILFQYSGDSISTECDADPEQTSFDF